jgi:hypothetical protein
MPKPCTTQINENGGDIQDGGQRWFFREILCTLQPKMLKIWDMIAKSVEVIGRF